MLDLGPLVARHVVLLGASVLLLDPGQSAEPVGPLVDCPAAYPGPVLDPSDIVQGTAPGWQAEEYNHHFRHLEHYDGHVYVGDELWLQPSRLCNW